MKTLLCALLLCSMVVFIGCSKDEPASDGWTVAEGAGDEVSYGDNSDVIVQPGGGDSTIIGGDGDGCVEIPSGECVDPNAVKDEYCGDDAAQADIILDEDGAVLDVICYPPSDDGTPIEEVTVNEDGTVEVSQDENGAVIVFGDETNGEPLQGDLTLTAERVSLFGNGVDNTIIDGNLTFSSNGAQARGLTVTGNVVIDRVSNNASLAFCRVHGNLEVVGSDVTIVNCEVFGNVVVSGTNATLINIGVQGSWEVHSSAYCAGCYSFSDENGDLVVSEAEIGDDLSCGEGNPTNVGGPPDNLNPNMP